ncbi:hypothetical protein BJ912DRAFT_632861 [Pholiota molesta]|nr:hypothetical protein BJ912DRAFT_632861 [Pholiota molesta]
MAELEHLREMDLRLLALHSQTVPNGFTPFWRRFFKDKTRAGEYYLDGKNYAAFAKEIIELVFPESDEDARQVRPIGKYDDESNYSTDESDANIRIPLHDVAMSFFKDILSKASQDSNLAQLLKDRFFQHETAMKPVAIPFSIWVQQFPAAYIDQEGDSDRMLRNFKSYSEQYLKTCGILPYTDRDNMLAFGGNFVVESPTSISGLGSPADFFGRLEPLPPDRMSKPGHESELHAPHWPASIPTFPFFENDSVNELIDISDRRVKWSSSDSMSNPGHESELHAPHRPASIPGSLHRTATSPIVENDAVLELIYLSPLHTPITLPDRRSKRSSSNSVSNPGHESESHAQHRPPSIAGSLHRTPTSPLVENDPVHEPIHLSPSHTLVTSLDRRMKRSIWLRLCPCLSPSNVES